MNRFSYVCLNQDRTQAAPHRETKFGPTIYLSLKQFGIENDLNRLISKNVMYGKS